MSAENQRSRRDKIDKKILLKLDSHLSFLMQMSDNEILEEIGRDRAERIEKFGHIRNLEDELTRKLSNEKRLIIQRRLHKLQEYLSSPSPLVGSLIIGKKNWPPILIKAIIHFLGNRDDLNAMGLEVGVQAHDIFTVFGTKEQLVKLASQPATISMELPMPLRPNADQAFVKSEITAVQDYNESAQKYNGLTGNGVIVGIIDTKLDVTHPSFRDNTKNSRVLYLWVQQPDDEGPQSGVTSPEEYDAKYFEGLAYGKLYDYTYINTALLKEKKSPGSGTSKGVYGNGVGLISSEPETGSDDPTEELSAEHGTMVAGVAVGNGQMVADVTVDAQEYQYERNDDYVGAAPEADIVFVSARISNEYGLLDAFKFIADAADKENKPCVINCSLYHKNGPHDGTRNVDRFIDSLICSYPERAVVVAVGNRNCIEEFRQGIIQKGSEEVIIITNDPNPQGSLMELEIWYKGSDPKYKLVGDPNDEWVQVSPLELERDFPLIGGKYNVSVFYSGGDAGTGIAEGYLNGGIRILMHNADPAAVLTIHLKAESNNITYYAWITSFDDATLNKGATSNEYTLDGIPSCCSSAITVGFCYSDDETIVSCSGCGPTLDNRIKPELVAIANPIGTTNSMNDKYPWKNPVFGSSFSSPLVAGAVALLFEDAVKYGYHLDQDLIKGLLINSANRDGLDPNNQEVKNQYGWGRLRLKDVIGKMEGTFQESRKVDLWMKNDDNDKGFEPFIGDVFWNSPDIEPGNSQFNWGQEYGVQVTIRNRGDRNATQVTVQLWYAKAGTSSSVWKKIDEKANLQVNAGASLPPLIFEWTPRITDFPNMDPKESHFCLLADVFNPDDPWEYSDKLDNTGYVDPWEMNVRSRNNLALHNVTIIGV